MSKFAILKSLPTPADVRQNVQQLSEMMEQTAQRLDATAAQVRSLEQLPTLVAEQVTETLKLLDPVLQMPGQVSRALEAVDQIARVQRETLGALAQELGTQVTASMERKTKELDEAISTLAGQVKGLKSSTANAEASCKKLLVLPGQLTETATHSSKLMQNQAKVLMLAAHAARPRVFLMLLQLTAAAMLGAMLVAVGQAGLSRILPPSETQQNADWAVNVWAKASESERKLLTAIASRPAP
jgi:uncharacterized protein YukE